MLQMPFPSPFILTTGPALLGLSAALGLAVMSVILLLRTRRKGTGVLYLLVSGFLGFTLVQVLVRAAGGVVCYRPPFLTLLLYGGLIALFLSFLFDAWQILRTERGLPQLKKGGRGE